MSILDSHWKYSVLYFDVSFEALDELVKFEPLN